MTRDYLIFEIDGEGINGSVTISTDEATDSEGTLLNLGKISFREFSQVIERHVRIIDSADSENQKLLKLSMNWGDFRKIKEYFISLRSGILGKITSASKFTDDVQEWIERDNLSRDKFDYLLSNYKGKWESRDGNFLVFEDGSKAEWNEREYWIKVV